MAGTAAGMVDIMVVFTILFLILGVDFIVLIMVMATVMAIHIIIIIMVVTMVVVMDMAIIGEIMVALKLPSLLTPQDLEQAVVLVLAADQLEPAEILALPKAIAICLF